MPTAIKVNISLFKILAIGYQSEHDEFLAEDLKQSFRPRRKG